MYRNSRFGHSVCELTVKSTKQDPSQAIQMWAQAIAQLVAEDQALPDGWDTI
jgi:hypothetical protein